MGMRPARDVAAIGRAVRCQLRLGAENSGCRAGDRQSSACAAAQAAQRRGRGPGSQAGRAEAGHRAARTSRRDAGRGPCREHGAALACAQATESAAQKKSIHATERDSEANRIRRKEFVETVRGIAPEDLIYLDESGVSTQMTRLYARAWGGQRVHDAVPGGHWKMLTILAR